MKAKHQSQIVFIDPNGCHTYTLTGSLLVESKEYRYHKSHTTISYLNSSEITKTQHELPKETPEEEIAETLSDLVIEENKLDSDDPLLVRYEPKESSFDGAKIQYATYSIDHHSIEAGFSKCLAQVPYIDYIIPTPFLFRGLYHSGILPAQGSHAFVYVGMRESLFLLFEDGALLYYRTLNVSFPKLLELHNSLSSQPMDMRGFSRLLADHASKSDEKKPLEKVYTELCMGIEEILLYIRRIYTITALDSLYIDGVQGFGKRFYAHAEEYLSTPAIPFAFDYGFVRCEGISHLGMLSLLLARELQKGLECPYNFTLFEKPKPFHQRSSGIFLIAAAASFLIAFAYPLWMWVVDLRMHTQITTLQLQNSQKSGEATELLNRLQTLETEKKNALTLLGYSQMETDRQFRILYDIYTRQKHYIPKTELLMDLSRTITESGVRLEQFRATETNTSNRVEMDLSAKEHVRLTNLISHLATNRQYTLAIDAIKQDSNTSRFVTHIGMTLQ